MLLRSPLFGLRFAAALFAVAFCLAADAAEITEAVFPFRGVNRDVYGAQGVVSFKHDAEGRPKFSGTDIGENPTDERGKYLILNKGKEETCT